MSSSEVVTDVDRMWLHDLGLAEDIETLVDPELSGKKNRISRDRRWNDCELCGCVPYALHHGPEGQRLCADCNEELVEWHKENTPELCANPDCRRRVLNNDDGLCGFCYEAPGDRHGYWDRRFAPY